MKKMLMLSVGVVGVLAIASVAYIVSARSNDGTTQNSNQQSPVTNSSNQSSGPANTTTEIKSNEPENLEECLASVNRMDGSETVLESGRQACREKFKN
jgi:hypothetical protein